MKRLDRILELGFSRESIASVLLTALNQLSPALSSQRDANVEGGESAFFQYLFH